MDIDDIDNVIEDNANMDDQQEAVDIDDIGNK